MSDAPNQRFEWSAQDPETCADMQAVRAGIDEIDRVLVAVIARRQGYIEAAARIKTDPDTVRDEERILDVLDKVQAEAWDKGLSWVIAEAVWRAMIERCIAHEADLFKQLHGQADPGAQSE
jgi:isochorismate pyruvate lyase